MTKRVEHWWLWLAVTGTLACNDPLLDGTFEGGTYFVLSGPVAETVQISGSTTRGAIAWAWLYDGQLGAAVDEVPFVPRVFSYELHVGPAPSPVDAVAFDAPSSLEGLTDVDLLWGLPLLFEPTRPDTELELVVDAAQLVAWVSGELDDATAVVSPTDPAAGELAAVTRGFLLITMRSDTPLARLDEHPDWSSSAPCSLREVIPGMTLYRRTSEDCEGWTPLAPAGERTEFQGVEMTVP